MPLVIWGENPQLEYGGGTNDQLKTTLDDEWLSKHGCMLETNSESWVGKADLTSKELAGYRLPDFSSSFAPTSIFLGSFSNGIHLKIQKSAKSTVSSMTRSMEKQERGPLQTLIATSYQFIIS